jgi:hypothetical protein
MSTHHLIESVTDIVQSGLYARNTLGINDLGGQDKAHHCK